MMLCSADTEVEQVAVSKGLKAVTSVGLKNKGFFSNKTKRTANVILIFFCCLAHSVSFWCWGLVSPQNKADLEGSKSLLLNLKRTQVKSRRRRLNSSAGDWTHYRCTVSPRRQTRISCIDAADCKICGSQSVCSMFECRTHSSRWLM